MNIKYEIHAIKNAAGEGKEHPYVRLLEQEPMRDNALERSIQNDSSLTAADVRAALMTIREYMISELSQGSRFHIPEIGYFSLSVALDIPEGKPVEKVRSDYLSVRGINFRPDVSLLAEVKRNARFEKATASVKSAVYTEDELEEKVRAYVAEHKYITRHVMEHTFHLRTSAARKWLALFVEKGLLRKEGPRTSPLYFPVG